MDTPTSPVIHSQGPSVAADVRPADAPRDGRLPRIRRRRPVYMGANAALVAVLSLAGAGAAVTLFGARTYHWRAFDVRVGIRPAVRGETRLVFTPLGEVRARTHDSPVALEIELTAISFEDLKKLIEKPPTRNSLEEEFRRVAERDLQQFAWWQIGIGAAGAIVAPLLLRVRRLRWWLACALLGGGFVAAVFWRSTVTYDRQAFDSPRYTGSLREASWIIALVKEGFVKADTLATRLRRAAGNLNTLYGHLSETPGFDTSVDTIRVLHISDMHNNPAAVDFVLELADKMKVDLVIDTGDLTDLGLPVENELSRGLARLKVPYLFVAGNHDSQATVAAVGRNPRAYILRGDAVTVAGLSVLGAPDPSSARAGAGSVDTTEIALQSAGAALAAAYQRSTRPPDIVCVHNPRMAEPLVGRAPLVLCGHVHRAYIEVRSGTVIGNAGTTGAAGVRYLDQRGGVPFTAEVLAFARSAGPHLLFVDQVSLDGALGSYSITRRSFNVAAPAAAESALTGVGRTGYNNAR